MLIETITRGDRTVEIHSDDHPCHPRREFDNLGTLAIRHIGDEEPVDNPFLADKIWLPVYRYEHGACCLLSTRPFDCPWDSALTGYIYVEKYKIRSGYGVKRISAKLRDEVLKVLKYEVQVMSDYLNGDVYGYVTSDGDSCWGFYGSDQTHMLQMAFA